MHTKKTYLFKCLGVLAICVLLLVCGALCVSASASEPQASPAPIAAADLGEPIEAWDISATTADEVVARLYHAPGKSGYYTLIISGTGDMSDWSAGFYSECPWHNAYESSILQVEIQSGVTSIGAYAFYGFTAIEEVVIGDSVKTIGNSAFYGCRSLRVLDYNAVSANDLTSWNRVFDNAGIGGEGITVTIGNQVKKIPGFLFCPRLEGSSATTCNITKLVFEENSACTEIGEWAFSNAEIDVVDICDLAQWCAFSFDDGRDSPVSIYSTLYLKGEKIVDLVIPDDVTSIGAYTFLYQDFESITIGKGVRTIGKNAFYECGDVTRIYFNATAMNDLTSSTSIFFNLGKNGTGVTMYVGKDVTKVPAYLFYPASTYTHHNLTRVVFDSESVCESIGEYAFYQCESLLSVTLSKNITSIGTYAFMSCNKLIEVINHSSLSITAGNYAHGYVAYCAKLVHSGNSKITNQNGYLFFTHNGVNYLLGYTGSDKVLVLPESFNGGSYQIYAYAFAYNKTYTEVYIPSGVTEIGQRAFSDCSAIHTVHVLGSISQIGDNAFYACSRLKAVYASSVADWVSISFSNANASPLYYGATLYIDNRIPTEIVVPGGVTKISAYAFYNCAGLTSIVLPEGITEISAYAFYNCAGLTSLSLPSSVTRVEDNAFYGCSNLQYRQYDNAYYLGNDKDPYLVLMRAINTQITSCTIHPNARIVYFEAFRGCQALTAITIPQNISFIGNYSFYDCVSVTEVHYNATSVADLSSSNNVFYNLGKNTSGVKVYLAKNVTAIPAYLFTPTFMSSYAPKITDIIFEAGSLCQRIGSGAFMNCTLLTSVTIPSYVTYVGSEAFANCMSLTEIVFNAIAMQDSSGRIFDNAGKNGTGITLRIGKQVTRIPAYLCRGYADSYTPNITEVIFEEGSVCQTIGRYAFYKCTKLTSIVIPATVTSIDREAFYACSKLAVLYIQSPTTAMDPINLLTYAKSIAIEKGIANISAIISKNFGYVEEIVWNQKSYTLYSKCAHKWEATRVISEYIQCQQDGIAAYRCTSCGVEKEDVIRMHDVTRYEAKAATCTEIGWAAYETCKNCSYTTYEEDGAKGHDIKTFQALAKTCTTPGHEAYEMCLRETCDYTTYKEIPPSHEIVIIPPVAPSCLDTGLTEGQYCSACQEVLLKQEVVEAPGHDKVTHAAKEPNCKSVGWDEYETCNRCDYTTYVEKPMTDHNYGAWVVTKNPTKSEKGVWTRVCQTDEAHTETADIPKLFKANYDKYDVFAEPDCENPGMEHYTIKFMGITFVFEYVERALDHLFGEGTVTTEPTCQSYGITTYLCSRCGETSQKEDVPPSDHTYQLIEDQYVCSGCSDSYHVSEDGTLTQDATSVMIRNVPNNFSFKLLYSGSKAELESLIKVIDSYYLGDASEHEGIAGVTIVGENGEFTVLAPASGYSSGRTYVVSLPNGVAFANYSARELQFAVKKSASQIGIDVNNDADVTYIKNDSVISRKEYDDYVWIDLLNASNLRVGGFVFISDAANEQELFGNNSLFWGDILLGKISDIVYNAAKGTYSVKLASPSENEFTGIFNQLKISEENVKIDWSQITEADRDQLERDLISRFEDYINGSDDFKKYLLSITSASLDYASGTGLTLTEKDNDEKIFDIDVDIGVDSYGEFYVTVTVTYVSDYTKKGVDAGYIETNVYFYNGVSLDVDPQLEGKGFKVYFDFAVVLTETTEIEFDIIYNVDPDLLGYQPSPEAEVESFKDMLIEKLKTAAVDGLFDTLETDSKEANYLAKLVKRLAGGSSDAPSIEIFSEKIGGFKFSVSFTLKFVFDFDISAITRLEYKRVEEHVFGARASLKHGIQGYNYNRTIYSDLDYYFIGSVEAKAGISLDISFRFFYFLRISVETQYGIYVDFAGICIKDSEAEGFEGGNRNDTRFEMGKYESVEVSGTIGIRLKLYSDIKKTPTMLSGRDRIYFGYEDGTPTDYEMIDEAPKTEDEIRYAGDRIDLENYYFNVRYYDLHAKSGKIEIKNDKLYFVDVYGKYEIDIKILSGMEYVRFAVYSPSILYIEEDAPAEFDIIVRITIKDAYRLGTQYSKDSAYYRLPEIDRMTIHIVNHDWVEVGRTEPTCSQYGYIYFECNNHEKCEHKITIPRLEHSHSEFVRHEDATCLRAEINVYRCPNCQKEVERVVKNGEKALGHRIYAGDYYNVVEPTLTSTGSKMYACSRAGCDYVETKEIPKLGYTDGLIYESYNGGWKVVGYSHADNIYKDTFSEIIIPEVYGGRSVLAIESLGHSQTLRAAEGVTIPKTVRVIEESAFFMLRYYSSDVVIELAEENAYFYEQDKCIIRKSDNTLIVGHNGATIPYDGSVTKIGAYAFYNVNFTDDFLIPYGITEIGDRAFERSFGLVLLVIPKSVETVGTSAFAYCTDIETVVKFKNTFITVGAYNLSDDTFYNCSGIKRIIYAEYDGKDSVWALRIKHYCETEPEIVTGKKFCGTPYIIDCPDCGPAHHFSPEYTKFVNCKEYKFSRCLHCGYNSTVGVFTGNTNHEMIPVAKKDKTCEKNGYTAHFACKNCSYKEDYEIIPASHDIVHHNGKQPTCVIGWDAYDTCNSCDYSTYVELPPVMDHNNVWYHGQQPTCTEGGWTVYSICARCGYNTYKALSAYGHDLVYFEGKEKSCTEIGWNAYEKCIRRGCDHSTYEEIPASHTPLSIPSVPPTCTNAGLTEGIRCKDCPEILLAQTEVTALGHALVLHEAKAPTCLESGWNAYESCTRCSYNTYFEIPESGHVFGESGACVICGTHILPTFKINSAYLVLTQDINVIYRTTVPGECIDAYMVFEFNGEMTTVTEYTVDEQGRLCFAFTGINPQKMGDNICATLYATFSGREISVCIPTYSIRQYCINQLNRNPDAALKQLISDLLVYGEKTQIYQNYKTDALVTDGLELTPGTFVELDASYNKRELIGTSDPNVRYSSASLELSNEMIVLLGITTDDPTPYTFEVTINGNTTVYTEKDLMLRDGKYYLSFSGVKATWFNDTISAVIKKDGVQISQTLHYSVYTYVQTYQNINNTKLTDLLKAIYNYGQSAKSYNQ